MSMMPLRLPDLALSFGPNVWRMSFLTSAEFALPPLSAAALSPDEESSPPQPSSPATSSVDTTPIKVFSGTAPPQVNAVGQREFRARARSAAPSAVSVGAVTFAALRASRC